MSSLPDLNEYPRLRALLTWLVGASPRELSPEDLACIRRRAAESGIGAIAEHFLRSEGIDADPARIQALQRPQLVLIRHHLRQLDKHLNIPFAVLKGEPLGRRLFEVASLRSTGDLDILVRPADIDRVISKARALGFEPAHSDAPNLFENNQFALAHRNSKLLLEIHWALDLPRVPSPSVDECLAHAVERDDVLGVRVFDDAFRILQASYHLFHHAGFLKGMVDLCALYDVASPSAVASARDIAERIGVQGMVDWGLAVAWMLTPAEPRRWSTPFAAIAALGWLQRAHGILSQRSSISGADLLGWKAADRERVPRALWGMVFAGLIDRWDDRLGMGLRTIFKDRRTLEAELGRPLTSLDRGRELLSRPIELIRKGASDLLLGD